MCGNLVRSTVLKVMQTNKHERECWCCSVLENVLHASCIDDRV